MFRCLFTNTSRPLSVQHSITRQLSLIALSSSIRFSSTTQQQDDDSFIPDFSHADDIPNGNNNNNNLININNKNSIRSVGQISKWVEDKGFGFVNLQGKSVFVHARELVMKDKGKTSPQREKPKLMIGQTVEFSLGSQPDGRLKAMKISQIGGIPLDEERLEQGKQETITSGAETSNDMEFDFDLGEGSEVVNKNSTNNSNKNVNHIAEEKSTFKKQPSHSNHQQGQGRSKLFSSYQWNCVESGNPAVDGFKVTQFPTNAAGNTEIPVPNEKWNDNNITNNNNSTKINPSSTSGSATAQLQDQKNKAAIPPLPSSNSRPIWESELLGWPTEFSAREMDFFDLEELEERRSGWIQYQK